MEKKIVIRDFIDDIRLQYVSDSGISPSRVIKYNHIAESESEDLNAFIGAGTFNEQERNAVSEHQSFGALALSITPVVNDTIEYDGTEFTVKRWTKMGDLYTIYAQKRRKVGRQ
jgi:hypothetical protein